MVKLGRLTVNTQRISGATQVEALSDGISFHLCKLPTDSCDERLRLSDKPIMIFIYNARTDWIGPPFAEKPLDGTVPAEIPMKLVMEFKRNSLPQSANWYPLSRMSLGDSGGRIETTDQEWPVAHCGKNLMQSYSCSLGFFIKDSFVEAHFFSDHLPTQSEIWRIASGIDDAVRAAKVHLKPITQTPR